MARRKDDDMAVVLDAIETGSKQRVKAAVSKEKAEERQNEGKTQGVKGAGGERFNITFTPKNFLFVSTMASATGQTIPQFVNQVLDVYQEDYPGTLERAQEFIRARSESFDPRLLRDPKIDTEA